MKFAVNPAKASLYMGRPEMKRNRDSAFLYIMTCNTGPRIRGFLFIPMKTTAKRTGAGGGGAGEGADAADLIPQFFRFSNNSGGIVGESSRGKPCK